MYIYLKTYSPFSTYKSSEDVCRAFEFSSKRNAKRNHTKSMGLFTIGNAKVNGRIYYKDNVTMKSIKVMEMHYHLKNVNV